MAVRWQEDVIKVASGAIIPDSLANQNRKTELCVMATIICASPESVSHLIINAAFVKQIKIVPYLHSINAWREFVSHYYWKMENSVLPQMNANQIFVWIQLVMETSSIILIANIIMTARADYVIIIYVLILK
jgi:hypothetical protein